MIAVVGISLNTFGTERHIYATVGPTPHTAERIITTLHMDWV